MKEYLEVADLRMSSFSYPSITGSHVTFIAPLTKEEIAAIDEAGAKGPPSALQRLCYSAGLRLRWVHVLLLFLILVSLLVPGVRPTMW